MSLDEPSPNSCATVAGERDLLRATYASQFVSLADMLPNVTAVATSTMSNTDAEFYGTGAINPAANIGDTDTDSYGVQVTQNLFGSGRYVNAFRSKRAEIRSEAKNLVNTEQQIILQAVTAYLDVIRDELIAEVNEQNVVVLSRQLEAVKDRFEVGVVTRTDIAQSEARLAGAKSNYLSAQARLLGARAVYREVVGLEPEDLFRPQSLPSLPESLEAARSSARAASPTLASAREMSDSGRYSAYSAIGWPCRRSLSSARTLSQKTRAHCWSALKRKSHPCRCRLRFRFLWVGDHLLVSVRPMIIVMRWRATFMPQQMPWSAA